MPTYDSGRAADLGGINIRQRRSSDLEGIRFDGNRNAPTSTDDFVLYRRADALYVWDGSTETKLGAGGGGAAGTLDSVYDNGRTITVDNGAVILAGTDEDTAVLSVTGDGDSAGALISLSHTTTSRNDILGSGSNWSVTGDGEATFVRVDLGDDEPIRLGDSNDAVLQWVSGSSHLDIEGATNFDGDMTIESAHTLTIAGTDGSTMLTITAGDLVMSDGGVSITDSDDAESFTFINNSATTVGAVASAGVLQVESTSLTTGAAVNVQLTEDTLNGGYYYSAWDATANVRVFSVAENGNVTITGAGDTDALTISNGDVTIDDGSITLVDADDAVSLSVTNNTATTSDVVEISGSGTGRVLHVTTAGAAANAVVDIESTEGGTTGPILRLFHQGGSQAANDVVGRIVFEGEDDAAADNVYGRIDAVATTAAAGSEEGRLDFYAGDGDGGVSLSFEALHDGTNGIVEIGDGSVTGILRSNGDFDLQIETGNSTTGNLTITDGANGNITLTPNGSGKVDIANALLLSKITTSSGEGAVSVTGNIHEITTTGADALTLADGTEGQVLFVVMVTDGGDGTLTPTNLAGNDTTITFDAVGDAVTLLFTNDEWYIVGQNGVTVA
jgi:hypothetical protein